MFFCLLTLLSSLVSVHFRFRQGKAHFLGDVSMNSELFVPFLRIIFVCMQRSETEIARKKEMTREMEMGREIEMGREK